MERKTTYIYTISYPEGNIRYVGKTLNPKQRFNRHMSDGRLSTKSHKKAWLNSLIKMGVKPVFEIVAEVPTKDWQYWEKFYISKYKELGFNLTNGTLGGEGLEATEEVRKKISDACREHWRTHDNWIKGKGGTEAAKVVGRKKGEKLPKELVERQCEVFRKYYETHEVWNKGKVFRVPDKNHIEMNMKSPKRRVLQFSLDGKLVRDWGSASAAAHILGYNPKIIRDCCKGIKEISYGYKWINKSNYEG